ncbi:MAG TPA: amidase [Vicinamibacterales bacterium]|nr:amidase [Vicinamibacterales bacterium]
MTTPKATRSGRRRFLRVLPGAVAGALAAPAFARQAAQTPPRITPDNLDGAEKIFGLDFDATEEQQALGGVNRDLASFEQLRAIDVPLDVEPPLEFLPYLHGEKPKPGATPGARLEVALQPPGPRPASLDDLAFAPITTLAPMLRRREISSTELTRMYLARIKKYGPKLNCIVTLLEDLALQQAADADTAIRAGHYKGPLHGIPWGPKDLFSVKGVPSTWGAAPYEHQVFDYDATIVERLREAGAVLVAKLSMGALAQGDRWFRGQTKNPWNPDDPRRGGSSGSSAGPGSATAAGLVVFGIGTETRGSIISPSSVNGVTGLRPTYGRVSRFGAMTLSWTMDKVGPMCRSVEDCALVFNAIYGPDGRDKAVVDAPFAWRPEVPLSTLKIGYVKTEFEPNAASPFGGGGRRGAAGREAGAGRGRGGRGMSEEERAQFLRDREQQLQQLNTALDVFRHAGATLEPIELPGRDLSSAIGFMLNVEAAAAFDDLTRSPEANDPSLGSWPNTFRTARFVPAVEYLRGQRVRTLLMREFGKLMAQYDVFLSPTSSASLGITNLTGHPALALKAGFVDNAPVELMLTGRLYDEATLLRVALAYERATTWHTMNPPMNWAG